MTEPGNILEVGVRQLNALDRFLAAATVTDTTPTTIVLTVERAAFLHLLATCEGES